MARTCVEFTVPAIDCVFISCSECDNRQYCSGEDVDTVMLSENERRSLRHENAW